MILARRWSNGYDFGLPSRLSGFEMPESARARTIFPVDAYFNLGVLMNKIKKILAQNNFDGYVYGYEAEPSYLQFSKIAYFLGTVYQRCAPKIFKVALFAFAQKIEG